MIAGGAAGSLRLSFFAWLHAAQHSMQRGRELGQPPNPGKTLHLIERGLMLGLSAILQWRKATYLSVA
jgi:hypothetical protein